MTYLECGTAYGWRSKVAPHGGFCRCLLQRRDRVLSIMRSRISIRSTVEGASR